jgi:hypothetical protein
MFVSASSAVARSHRYSDTPRGIDFTDAHTFLLHERGTPQWYMGAVRPRVRVWTVAPLRTLARPAKKKSGNGYHTLKPPPGLI